jgi:hypothetical protein
MTYHNPIPDDLKRDWGIVTIAQDFLPDEFRRDYTLSDKIMMALDAQPALVTTPSAGVPFFATTFVDPDVVRVLQTPNKGAEILGEKKLGDWTTTTAQFQIVENTGRVVGYGDFNDDGNTNVNTDFAFRQSFSYQTIVEYGDKATELAGLAKLNYVSEMKLSATKVMDKFADYSYHFGIAGLQSYGIINDPNLSAALTPSTKAAGGTKWVNNGIVVASPNEITVDVQALVAQLISQSPGYIDPAEEIVMVGPPIIALALGSTNSFGLTAQQMLDKVFKLTVITDPRYATAAGNLIQLWAKSYDGNDVGFCGFGEKLREFPVVRELSASKQKVAGTTFGAIIKYPLAAAQMLGV